MIFSARQQFPILMMARLLNVSKSGYYSWVNRQSTPSKRQVARDQRDHLLRVAFKENSGRFGSPSLTKYLNRNGVRVCVNTVATSMRRLGLAAVGKFKKKQTTFSDHSLKTAENKLDRDFSVHSKQAAWACDITYIKTKTSWLYLAVVMNLRSRIVLGWSLSTSMSQELVISALKKAIDTGTETKNTIHHSDRGSQYCSKRYQKLLALFGFKVSMSRPGKCHDNAVVESFFGCFKREIKIQRFKSLSLSEAIHEVNQYICWYNSERIHSTLNHQTPLDFESQLSLAN